MKKLTKLLSMVLALALALSCFGVCAFAAGEEEPAADVPVAEDLTIAVSTIAYSIAVLPQVLIDNLQALCEENGWEFIMQAAEGDPMKQGEQISTLVARHPDYLVIFPADPMLAIDWCQEAADEGVPAICMHVDVAEECHGTTCLAYCGIDNEAVVTNIFNYMIEKNGADAALNLVEIGGVPDQADYIVRTGTFNDLLADSSYTQLGDIAWAYSSRAEAQTAMESFIGSYGDQINILVGFDDDLTMGGVNALQEAGMTDVHVYSITGQKEAMAAIQEGKMDMTVFTSTKTMAEKVVEVINRIENGETVDYYQYIDAPVVDADNVADYVDLAEF